MTVLIPARIGSKGVPLKNLRMLGGYPLVAWSIAAGRLLGLPVVVSTDSLEIADVALRCQAIQRVTDIHSDKSTDIDVVRDALEIMNENTEIIYLRPSTPLRNPVILRLAIDIFYKCEAYSMRSMHEMAEPCGKMYGLKGQPLLDDHDQANAPRQSLLPTYHPNGYIDIFKTDRLSEGLFLEPFQSFITTKTVDIDTEGDLEYANWKVKREGHCLLDYMRSSYGRW